MSESERIRVMVVDDHEILRRGVWYSLQAFDDLELVGEARSGEDALRLCGEVQPDVVLMDMLMPGLHGVDTTRGIRSRYPGVRVLVLSSYHDSDLVQRAIQAGAAGYLVKGLTAKELAEAIRATHAGWPALSPEALEALALCADASPKPGNDLTDREREVLSLMAKGLSNAEIARRLTVSLSTVKYHVRGVFFKLGAANRAEAVALALEHNLITGDSKDAGAT